MRILHVLDHSLPLQSGYTFRTRAIVKAQLARGWEVACLTGPRHAAERSRSGDGRRHHLPPHAQARAGAGAARASGARSARCRARLDALVEQWRPDQLHAHSPVLTALAALPVARAARPAPGLRDPRLLGGCGGRQRHRARRLAALPADPAARDQGGAPGRRGRGDLRGAARRPDRARHRAGQDLRLAQRRRHGPVRRSARRRRGASRAASGSKAPTWSASSARSTIMRGSTI